MTNSCDRLPWPERWKKSLHIFALGETFDVDKFLETSQLKPDFIWRRMGNGLTNGLELFLGDGNTIQLREQEKIAIQYLKGNEDELRALAQFPGVEAVILGFVYQVPMHATGVCLGPSFELMVDALKTGVSPNYYVWVPQQDDCE